MRFGSVRSLPGPTRPGRPSQASPAGPGGRFHASRTGRLGRLSAGLAAAVLGAGAPAQAQPLPPPPGGMAPDVPQVSVQLDTMTLIGGKQGDIEVLQLLRVINEGAAAYTGDSSDPAAAPGTRGVLRLPVPEGAFDVAPADAGNPQGLAQSPQGIISTVALPPGETLISYIYRIRPTRTGWALRREVHLPTPSIDLLVGPGLELKAAGGFRLQERKKLGAVEYRRYRAGPFAPGNVVSADVGFAGSDADPWAPFATAAAALAAVALGAVWFARRRKRADSASARPASAPETRPLSAQPGGGRDPSADRDALVLEIALLDEQFDSGSIAEAAYRARRRQMKEKLSALGGPGPH